VLIWPERCSRMLRARPTGNMIRFRLWAARLNESWPERPGCFEKATNHAEFEPTTDNWGALHVSV
jgi:hypothetical protein